MPGLTPFPFTPPAPPFLLFLRHLLPPPPPSSSCPPPSFLRYGDRENLLENMELKFTGNGVANASRLNRTTSPGGISMENDNNDPYSSSAFSSSSSSWNHHSQQTQRPQRPQNVDVLVLGEEEWQTTEGLHREYYR